MSRVDTAAPDRLPWLQDEPSPAPARQRSGPVVRWAAAAIAVVAAGAFWLGVRSVNDQAPQEYRRGAASTTVRLPAPRRAEPQVSIPAQPEVQPLAAPEVRPAPVREVHITPPRAVRSAGAAVQKARVGEKPDAPSASIAAQPAAESEFVPPRPWDPRLVQSASGRVVQVGAFGTTHQAKEGWWFMVRSYPAVAHLPAVVRTSRNSKGRVFYRFQVGTTSQAHSEILCQRMQRIGLSCAVVGLPWKAKVER